LFVKIGLKNGGVDQNGAKVAEKLAKISKN